jgi:hypothetical protein
MSELNVVIGEGLTVEDLVAFQKHYHPEIYYDLNPLDTSRTEVVERAYTYNEELNVDLGSELIDATEFLLKAGFSEKRIEEIKAYINEEVSDE